MVTRKGIPDEENSRGITLKKETCDRDVWRSLIEICEHICDCNDDPSQSGFWDYAGKAAKIAKKGGKKIVSRKAIVKYLFERSVEKQVIPEGSTEDDIAEGGQYDPDTPPRSAAFREERQKCVQQKLMRDYAELVDETGPVAPLVNNILVEHPYFMPKSGGALPLISSKLHNMDTTAVKWSRWNAAARLKKIGISQEHIDSYIKGEETYASLRRRGMIPQVVPKYVKGDRRAWDTIILKDTVLKDPATGKLIRPDATADNIAILGEIKFCKDDWDQSQWDAAKETVGGYKNKGKIQTLTPESCMCDGDEQKLDDSWFI